MPRGAKPGERRGGRKKGSPNKASLAAISFFENVNFDPLERMIEEYHEARNAEDHLLLRLAKEVDLSEEEIKLLNERISSHRRDRTALLKELCAYRHPKLTSVTMKGDKERPLSVSINWGKTDG